MQRRALAVLIVLVGLVIGIVGNILLYGRTVQYPGVSFPIFVLIIVTTLILLHKPIQQQIQWRNLWILIPLIFFSVMIAIRADPLIVLLNGLAVLALGGLALHYLPLAQSMDEDPVSEYGKGILFAGIGMFFRTPDEIRESGNWLREKRLSNLGLLGSFGRGILFAIPIILAFAVLLGSADLVFAEYLDQIWSIFAVENLIESLLSALFTLVLAWFAIGGLAYGLAQRASQQNTETSIRQSSSPALDGTDEVLANDEVSEQTQSLRKQRPGFRVGMIEAGIILISINVLFAIFVMIQFAYLFGGQENIAEGLTFAQYARRGFFELVAVCVMTLGLVRVLDHITVRRAATQGIIFRIMSVILIGLTLVLLISAWHRMSLYELAYGFTHLRLYTHIFTLWLAVLLGIFLLDLFRVKKAIFSLGSLLTIIGYLVTLNVINVEQFIAERNIARYQEGSELDICYLRTFSVDALPAMMNLYETTEDSDLAVHANVIWWLKQQIREVDSVDVDGLSFNVSRNRAWHSLQTFRDRLPMEYDEELEKYRSCYRSHWR